MEEGYYVQGFVLFDVLLASVFLFFSVGFSFLVGALDF